MNTKELFDKILGQISVYPHHEAREIVFWLMEYYLGLKKMDVLMNKKVLQLQEEEFWDKIIYRINNHEPIQYIIGETEFYGRKFLVNQSVLIPRPETEELVELVLNSSKKQANLSVLDIGTGSGCIAITLAKELKDSKVTAYDISEKALKMARKNAKLNKIEVNFQKVDILSVGGFQSAVGSRQSAVLSRQSAVLSQPPVTSNQQPTTNNQPPATSRQFDIIVSNPPYVTRNEARQMRQNVLDFEPHLALFVENDNALIFYEAIARFAIQNLKKDGFFAVEINEALGSETAEVFRRNGFLKTEIIKDIFQKERFVKAMF